SGARWTEHGAHARTQRFPPWSRPLWRALREKPPSFRPYWLLRSKRLWPPLPVRRTVAVPGRGAWSTFRARSHRVVLEWRSVEKLFLPSEHDPNRVPNLSEWHGRRFAFTAGGGGQIEGGTT